MPQLEHLQLVAQELVHLLQGLLPRRRGQQCLRLGHVHAQQRRQQVQLLHHVLGLHDHIDQRHGRVGSQQLRDLVGHLQHFPMQRVHLGGRVLRLGQPPDFQTQVRLAALDFGQFHPIRAEHEQMHGVVLAFDLLDRRQRADFVQVGRADVVGDRVALSHDDDRFVFSRQRRIDRGHGGGPAHGQRENQVRKQDAIANRQHGIRPMPVFARVQLVFTHQPSSVPRGFWTAT